MARQASRMRRRQSMIGIAEDGEEEIDGKDKGEYASDRNNMVNS